MKQLSKWLLLVALPLLLALVVPAAAGKVTPSRSVPTSGEVTGLAFYGARVAYGVRPYGVLLGFDVARNLPWISARASGTTATWPFGLLRTWIGASADAVSNTATDHRTTTAFAA
jgi:hypothetical protein